MTRTIEIIVPFRPRAWQRPLIADPALRVTAVVHRRAGKSTALIWRGIKRVCTVQLPTPRVVSLLPLAVMWDRTGLWDVAEAAARYIPGAKANKTTHAIRFPNGGVWQAGGADNIDSWRGGYADEMVLDEYDDMPGLSLTTVVEPMLADRNGVLIRSGTPKGRGLLEAAYQRALVTPGHSAYLLKWNDTKVLSGEAIARLRQEMTEEEFAQEMECSFVTPNSGSYYGKELQKLLDNGQITEVPHDPRLQVTTAWDLGVADSTSIWFVQITRGGQWRVIDHLSDSGVGLGHYVKLLNEREYSYERHLLPHDVEVTELGSGVSRRDTLHSLGVRNIDTVPSGPGALADGINAVRQVLPRCWFDAKRCAAGLKSLKAYHREWNEANQVWRSSPTHDFSSHDADAFRMLAVGAREPRQPVREFKEAPAPMEQGTASTRWMAA